MDEEVPADAYAAYMIIDNLVLRCEMCVGKMQMQGRGDKDETRQRWPCK